MRFGLTSEPGADRSFAILRAGLTALSRFWSLTQTTVNSMECEERQRARAGEEELSGEGADDPRCDQEPEESPRTIFRQAGESTVDGGAGEPRSDRGEQQERHSPVGARSDVPEEEERCRGAEGSVDQRAAAAELEFSERENVPRVRGAERVMRVTKPPGVSPFDEPVAHEISERVGSAPRLR